MSSYLGAGKINKILNKRKERGGIPPLSGSKTIIWDLYKGKPQKKKRDAMGYFQKETSYYKHHQSLTEKYKISSQPNKKREGNKFLDALSKHLNSK